MLSNTELGFPVQFLRTSTNFYHCRIGFHLEGIDPDLKPYLVLFQELIVETDLEILLENGEKKRIPYKDVVRQLSEEVVSMECGVGFGNEMFACGFLSDAMLLYGVAEATKYDCNGCCANCSKVSLTTEVDKRFAVFHIFPYGSYQSDDQ
jgi:hypothetical protein